MRGAPPPVRGGAICAGLWCGRGGRAHRRRFIADAPTRHGPPPAARRRRAVRRDARRKVAGFVWLGAAFTPTTGATCRSICCWRTASKVTLAESNHKVAPFAVGAKAAGLLTRSAGGRAAADLRLRLLRKASRAGRPRGRGTGTCRAASPRARTSARPGRGQDTQVEWGADRAKPLCPNQSGLPAAWRIEVEELTACDAPAF